MIASGVGYIHLSSLHKTPNTCHAYIHSNKSDNEKADAVTCAQAVAMETVGCVRGQ